MNRPVSSPSLLNRAYMSIVDPLVNGKSQYQLPARLKKLQRLERMSVDELRARQLQATQKLLQHAYDSTPFYRTRLDEAGIVPADISCLEDLQKIPALTREDIRNNLDRLWSRRYPRESLQQSATGGTTGAPVVLLRSNECLAQRFAVQLHLDGWAQLWPGDKIFRLWGAQQDFNPNPSWRWRMYDRYVRRNVWAPTSLFSAEILEKHRELMNDFRPKIVYAYPTPLALFCEYLRSCGKTYHRPTSAICTAEPLQDHQREIIEQTLACPVFEQYGSRDFGIIGAQCEARESMHLHPAAAYVEFLPISGAEREGLHEILVTDLTNDAMPLIRYQIGDCAFVSSSPCSCGRSFPAVTKIAGRITDNFYMANGNVIPGVIVGVHLTHLLRVRPGIAKVQLVQDTTTEFRVRYVPGITFDASDIDFLRSKLRAFFTDQVTWKFERVEEIERERSGKTRFCISHVGRENVKSEGVLYGA